MSIEIHVLKASVAIRKHEDAIRMRAESAILKTKRLLPVDDVDLVIYENPGASIEEIGGLGGFTPNARTIFISLDPQNKDFEKALNDELEYVVCHELHHTVRWQKEVEGDTLLEALIFEGLAEHFALEATGRSSPSPWAYALSADDKRKMFEKAREVWLNESYDNSEWFFGSKPEKVPRWTGYTLGYDLVDHYLKKHPEATAASLATSDAEIFVNR